MDINDTVVLFCVLFTILIVNTELEHYLNIIGVTLLYWHLVMKKKFYNKKLNFIKKCCKIKKLFGDRK